MTHLKSLHDYLESIKEEKPLQKNYSQICYTSIYDNFRTTMLRTRGTNIVPGKVDLLFKNIMY